MTNRVAFFLSGALLAALLLGSNEAALADIPSGITTMLDRGLLAEAPEEKSTAPSTEGGNPSWHVGGGLQLDISLGERDWNTSFGFGGLGLGMAALNLLPGKSYPFPAVITADVELIYFSAESGISDIHFTAHGCFGVDLLHKVEALKLFPYVGIGLGLEIVSGTKRIGGVRIDADDTRLILPWELGMGFTYAVTEKLSMFARFGFSFPVNPANVSFFLRLQGGILVTL